MPAVPTALKQVIVDKEDQKTKKYRECTGESALTLPACFSRLCGLSQAFFSFVSYADHQVRHQARTPEHGAQHASAAVQNAAQDDDEESHGFREGGKERRSH